jgi:hypothetical protein
VSDFEPESADPELYLQGKRYLRDVALPKSPNGAEGMVGVTILVPLEVQESEGAALKHCRAMATQYGLTLDELLRYSPTMLEDERITQVLSRALRQPGAVDAPWAGVGKLRTLLTMEQQRALFAAYCEVQQEVSPFVDRLTAEELDGVIDVLGKGSAPPELLAYSSGASLRALIGSLARRLRSGATASSSP